MGGVSLTDGTLVVEREPNRLDELAIPFSELLADRDVDHVFVSGYLAILAGRPRGTNDVDVIVERLDRDAVDALVEEFDAAGYWGPAMPLEEMYGNLDAGTNIWVAPDGEMTPHLEVKFPTDPYDRASLSNAITAEIGDATIPVGPIDLQIAYKLSMGAQKDFEDAAHLYTMFHETLSTERLEHWVERLGVTEEYARLESL
ncbi:MAG: hypothetical protein ABEJ42_01710 [Halobacteriaceae archaeon]